MSDEAVSKPEGSFAKPTAFLKPIRRPEKKPKENEVVVVGDKEVVETPSDIPEKNVEVNILFFAELLPLRLK